MDALDEANAGDGGLKPPWLVPGGKQKTTPG
jgi:hypothetical protein